MTAQSGRSKSWIRDDKCLGFRVQQIVAGLLEQVSGAASIEQMGRRRLIRKLTVVILMLSGCARQSALPARQGGDVVLSILGGDTVLEVQESAPHVEWRSSAAGLRWRSGRLVGAAPSARLFRLGHDSAPSMWTSYVDEEMLGAVVYRATSRGIERTYVSDSASCAVPELRDVDRDGLLDIVEHLPGALPLMECRNDATTQPCIDRYHLTWERALIQGADGRFSDDSSRAKAFYRSQYVLYGRSATRLRDDIDVLAPAADACDREMLSSLQLLAQHAKRLADSS